jgi:hypothetical protein
MDFFRINMAVGICGNNPFISDWRRPRPEDTVCGIVVFPNGSHVASYRGSVYGFRPAIVIVQRICIVVRSVSKIHGVEKSGAVSA